MLKKNLCFILLFLAACVVEKENEYCPYAVIRREDSRLIQKVNYQDDFLIEMTGWEGYCYYDSRVKKEKAVIVPIFMVSRLRDSDETDVQFSWFANTLKGPPAYLGKRTFFASVSLGAGQRQKEFKGKPVEIKVPSEMKYEFEILLGVDASKKEKNYNSRLFDVEYNAEGDYPSAPRPEAELKEYPENFYEDGTPVKPRFYGSRSVPQSSGCGSCR